MLTFTKLPNCDEGECYTLSIKKNKIRIFFTNSVSVDKELHTFSIPRTQMSSMLTCFTADPNPLGRVDIVSLSQQTLMELVIGDMPRQSKRQFQDRHGNYLPIDSWWGLDSDDSGNVVAIKWANAFVNGNKISLTYLPQTVETVEITNMSSDSQISFDELPRNLRYLCLTSCRFQGTVNLENLPQYLRNLQILKNRFSRSISIHALPAVMHSLNISHNSLSGSLDFSSLPASMRLLNISYNRFSGSVCLENLPDGIEVIHLQSNRFTGKLFVDCIPDSLEVIHVKENRWSGKPIGSAEKMQRVQTA